MVRRKRYPFSGNRRSTGRFSETGWRKEKRISNKFGGYRRMSYKGTDYMAATNMIYQGQQMTRMIIGGNLGPWTPVLG